jgi:thiamine-monophosphate kinase
VVVVAGELGAAAAGVALLRAGKKTGTLVSAYTKPVPRLDVARALMDTDAVRGAIDVSDGLSSDLIHLCRASRVGCVIHARSLPVARGVPAFCRARGVDPYEWALHAGEDYALILSIPRDRIAAACRAIARTGARSAIIGRFTRDRSCRIVDARSRERVFRAGGWDHMKRSAR